jgi:hypothetical protein
VGPEAVANQHPWLSVSSLPGLRIKHAREPLQANLGVVVPFLRVRIVPPGRLVCGPVASMGRSRPDDKGQKGPAVTTYALNRVGSQVT